MFEEGIAWLSGWHGETVLVSLATGRSQLLLPFELGAPEVFLAASRMLFASGNDGWLVAHAEPGGMAILDPASSDDVRASG